MATPKRLTAKQQSFINQYIQCWNATEAARLAGYSDRTAYSIGQENLNKPEIFAEIERRMQENAMSADETLSRLSDQARTDMSDFLEVRHNWVNVDLEKAKDLGLLRHIKKVKPTKYGTEIELYSSQAALQTLAKAHGMLHDKIEVNINIELVVNAWRELEEAGLSAADAFQELINIARARKEDQAIEVNRS